MDKELAAYEILGVLVTATMTIEVALYAITASIASRITRYSEEGTKTEIEEIKSGIDVAIDRASEAKDKKEYYSFIKESISNFESKYNEKEKIRKVTGIGRALFLPASISLTSIIVLLAGVFSGFHTNVAAGLSLLLWVLSIIAEINVLLVIDKVLKWQGYDGIERMVKIEELLSDLDKRQVKGEDVDFIRRKLSDLESLVRNNEPLAGVRDSYSLSEKEKRILKELKPKYSGLDNYECAKCSYSETVTKGKGKPFSKCPICGSDDIKVTYFICA